MYWAYCWHHQMLLPEHLCSRVDWVFTGLLIWLVEWMLLQLWLDWLLILILHKKRVKKLTKHEPSINTGLDTTHGCCSCIPSSLSSSSSPTITTPSLAILWGSSVILFSFLASTDGRHPLLSFFFPWQREKEQLRACFSHPSLPVVEGKRKMSVEPEEYKGVKKVTQYMI